MSCSHAEHCHRKGSEGSQEIPFDHRIKTINGYRCLKKVVCPMKRTKRNAQMPHGQLFNQKVEARFGTVCDVVEKFFKASAHVPEHLDESTMHGFDAITTQEDHFHGSRYPNLIANGSCF